MRSLFYSLFILILWGNSLVAQNYYYTLDYIPKPITNVTGTYYVSSTGNDENSGTSENTAWKSLTKVNSSTFKAGDNILFKKGDTFYGTIKIKNSGTSAAPITFSAYGSGNAPILTGFTTISGWSNEGGGIYSKVITSESQTNMVTINGVNTSMGRFPNTGYLTYESARTNVSITDNQLFNSINWTGAEAVIRKNDWTLDRSIITDQSNGVVSYTSLGTNANGTANYGYFIQNDLRTLDQLGEWYHDTNNGKFYMFFGNVNPTTLVIKVSTLENLISNTGTYDYITIDNLSLMGSIGSAVRFSFDNNYCNIQNNNISFSGKSGIVLFGAYGKVDNNQISDSGGYGVYSYGTNAVITNNSIKNLGLIPGQSIGPLTYLGIFVQNSNSLVQYNHIETVAYHGISIASDANNVLIKNNFINNTSLVLNDGGGIYIDGMHSSVKIDGNIILNAIGNYEGTTKNFSLAEGIYLDEKSGGIEVTNNTVAGSLNSGVKFHKAGSVTLLNNTTYNNGVGLSISNWTGVPLTHNNIITDNIFFAKNVSQLSLKIWGNANDNTLFGIADNNYYVRPIDDTDVIYTLQPSTGEVYRTLSGWQAFSGQDANSKKSPVAISSNDDLLFEYNNSKTQKTISLDYPMIDVMGNKYSGRITLQPYSSVILIKTN